jgi:hypothetical protein
LGDEAKEMHHQDQLVVGYRFSPCKGGSASQILRRRAVIHASLRSQLSTALAREVSERVFAYIRGARRFHGRIVDPVSALLL